MYLSTWRTYIKKYVIINENDYPPISSPNLAPNFGSDPIIAPDDNKEDDEDDEGEVPLVVNFYLNHMIILKYPHDIRKYFRMQIWMLHQIFWIPY